MPSKKRVLIEIGKILAAPLLLILFGLLLAIMIPIAMCYELVWGTSDIGDGR